MTDWPEFLTVSEAAGIMSACPHDGLFHALTGVDLGDGEEVTVRGEREVGRGVPEPVGHFEDRGTFGNAQGSERVTKLVWHLKITLSSNAPPLARGRR